MKKIVTITMIGIALLLLVACGGCGKEAETSVEQQLENATRIKRGDSERTVQRTLGEPHSRSIPTGFDGHPMHGFKRADWVYGDTRIRVVYIFLRNSGNYAVSSVVISTPKRPVRFD